MINKTKKLSGRMKKRIVKLRRKPHHPLVHRIHKKHHISYKTLLYMKEYGPKSHVAHLIIRESLKILILASILSSIGGFGLQSIQSKLFTILPLIILLPALNDMIGDFGVIVSSKFTTMLYLGKIRGASGGNRSKTYFTPVWLKNENLHKLFFTILCIAIISSVYMSVLSLAISYLKGFQITLELILKIMQISLISVILLVSLIFSISISFGLWIYRKKEDPNNFLIPIATSIGDLGSMALFSLLVFLLF